MLVISIQDQSTTNIIYYMHVYIYIINMHAMLQLAHCIEHEKLGYTYTHTNSVVIKGVPITCFVPEFLYWMLIVLITLRNRLTN